MLRALPVHQVLFLVKGLAPYAVLPFIILLVDVLFFTGQPDLVGPGRVFRGGSANEPVVGDIKDRQQVYEPLGVPPGAAVRSAYPTGSAGLPE